MVISSLNGITIHKPNDKRSPIKLYANVPSKSRPGLQHTITFVRKTGMERWTCTCEDQNITQVVKGRHCRHIKQVRRQIEYNKNAQT